MICRGEGENVGTFTVKPGTYEPIFGIYDPVGGCGGTMGTVLDRDFEIDPHDISYTMMEPVSGEWKSDRIDLYTPQDCFGFSDPFGGRIEYSEKKPKAVVAVKPDPVELGHRASVAASSTVGDRARGAGIRQLGCRHGQSGRQTQEAHHVPGVRGDLRLRLPGGQGARFRRLA